MSIFTKRWNDPYSAADGWRILICRYRPRALKKADETWHTWFSSLGPSKKLHADAYGKNRAAPITFEQYKRRYLTEMQKNIPNNLIVCLARIVALGGKITLLCSSACTNENKCHRSLLKELILTYATEATQKKIIRTKTYP